MPLLHGDAAGEPLVPAPTVEAWKEALASLPYYPRDADTGYNVAQGVPLKEAHRHFSHLLMIYPLALESWEDEQARHIIAKSVDHWAGLCGSSRACAGYSHTATSIMSSIMGRPEAALGNITRLLLEREDGFFPASVTDSLRELPTAVGDAAARGAGGGGERRKKRGMGPVLGPNTMYGERCKKQFADPCPVIETPLHAAEALHSMLLSSRAGIVDIFPAVPSSWPRAAFHGMRAEGGLVVSAEWSEGRTRFVAVERATDAAPDTFDVRHRFAEGEQVTVTPGGVTVKHVREGVVRVSGRGFYPRSPIFSFGASLGSTLDPSFADVNVLGFKRTSIAQRVYSLAVPAMKGVTRELVLIKCVGECPSWVSLCPMTVREKKK